MRHQPTSHQPTLVLHHDTPTLPIGARQNGELHLSTTKRRRNLTPGTHANELLTHYTSFDFRPKEQFEYVYDFGDNWEHQITVEKILQLDSTQTYPLCITGRGKCPPEDSGGPWMYMARRQGKRAGDDKNSFNLEPVNRLLRNLQSGWFTRPKDLG